MKEDLKFEAFKGLVSLSMEDLSRDLFQGNRDSIKIKKEGVAVRNLEKILNAALTLSSQKGFAAMSLRDLSRKAGLSMGALYTYFTSKEELLHMIQGQSAVVMQVLVDQLKGIDDPRVKLKRAIQAHLFLSEILREWFYFSYMETKNLGKEEHRKAIESELFTEKLFVDILREGNRTGVFREVDTDLLGAVLKAMLQDWYLKRWKYARRKTSVEKYADFLVELVESYLLSPHQ
ncbi:MAG TPA: TetR/AcrR family transcriptional regulator [Deltaproteobacteria bacterium]|jgi:AcrR family transcriptional regulator|nr:TetR/AcrR family transcriptional regulator [Deltaproteobacteria bacterium]HRW79608.1 TetR/AcrR family transcriptional regulator [Desulfomonilia bacterium]HNS88494.1 TetR/AcrR family transcriptional regulator [Deltaproteobacteria bacterium]HOA43398.1 TetR/AcrR family transcriptional regulator [Deltaproteobacteria bacterium]HOC74698.1 TetR/AcrR family transcriptional regulator [Deltaproteobacteria bacterium]